MSARIYLADLRHNYCGVLANDCMPLGVAYMKAVLDRDLPEAQSRLFAYPDRLLAALQSAPPDVLMLSNYMWNEALSLHFAAVAKRLRPETLVVMGGPNLSLEPERQMAYLAAHPQVDVYVLGEGDFLAREVVEHYLAADGSLARFGARDVPSCIYRGPDGGLRRSPPWERDATLEEIPSPWLSGVLDEFFDGKLAPLLETNRGCPFQCTFCVQGVRWYTKVHNFSTQRLRDEIDYIGRTIQARSPNMGFLRIADSNYGMFERDLEISSTIAEAQAKYGWPTYIDATTGKNRPERVIQSLEKVNGAMVIYQSVQSLDEDTLRNIKRQNISTDAYGQVMIHVRGRGLRSLSDVILALPGESMASYIAGINRLIDSGTDEMHLFQAMLLKGSELETTDSRQRYRFETRFRVLPKNYGVYADEMVFDVDEIVVATEALRFEEYLQCRVFALTCSIFWNNSWFHDAVRFAASFGVPASEWMAAMCDAIQRDAGVVGDMVRAFVDETRNELFPSRQACVAFYRQPENFERLQRGEIGENLMYKYRALAGFFRWPEVCAVALHGTRALLAARGAADAVPDFARLWSDFHAYVEHKHTHGATRERLLLPTRETLHYDIEAWIAAGMPHDASAFRLARPQTFVFEVAPDAARELDGLLTTWSTNLRALTKGITRMRTTTLTRHCRLAEQSDPYAAAAAAG
jgi:radical SAM superfamily enzyme YgiQ (UPF0313 family)